MWIRHCSLGIFVHEFSQKFVSFPDVFINQNKIYHRNKFVRNLKSNLGNHEIMSYHSNKQNTFYPWKFTTTNQNDIYLVHVLSQDTRIGNLPKHWTNIDKISFIYFLLLQIIPTYCKNAPTPDNMQNCSDNIHVSI